jgi:hypothetical protein
VNLTSLFKQGGIEQNNNVQEKEQMEFKREERYLVLKRNRLTEDQKAGLAGLALDKATVDPCLVIEEDWPCYEAAWAMVERVEEGTFDPNSAAETKTEPSYIIQEKDKGRVFYWALDGLGYTDDVNKAQRYTVQDIMTFWSKASTGNRVFKAIPAPVITASCESEKDPLLTRLEQEEGWYASLKEVLAQDGFTSVVDLICEYRRLKATVSDKA